jgi:aminoglycoside phosphotransferase (APT) family kinase protein
MGGRRRTLGERIATGNTSDVWRWTPTTVVKVLHRGIPAEWATLEADITGRVRAAGLPAPATDGVVEVDGRPGIVFEAIDGNSLWSHMKAAPADLPSLVGSLVDLQTEIHAAGAIPGLPDLGQRLQAKISAADPLSVDERDEALQLLVSFPVGTALCHGDMHPANVLVSARGFVVIDWFDAAIGHPGADLARSSLLMRPQASRRSIGSYLGGATGGFLDRLHAAYLDLLARRGLVDGLPFEAWEAVQAVARVSEPLPTDELVAFWRAWRTSWQASRPRPRAEVATGR